MGVTEGMDVARVRASARSIIDEAGRFGQSRTESRRVASRLVDVWRGPDSQDFQQGWRSTDRKLEAVEESLRAFAREALRQADGQERVSEDLGGGSTGGGGDGGDGVGSGNPDIQDDDKGSQYEQIEGPVVEGGVQPTDVQQGAPRRPRPRSAPATTSRWAARATGSRRSGTRGTPESPAAKEAASCSCPCPELAT